MLGFLERLSDILQDDAFDINTDLILVRKKKRKEKERFSTPYTLLDLDYGISDIAERLKELTIKEYAETLIDKDDVDPPLLFVFGKDINQKQVYIKLKIKGNQSKQVLCVSFHYAEEKMLFPYAETE